MKIVVNRGRTVRVAVAPSVQRPDGTRTMPKTSDHGPGTLLEVPDDEAKRLIALGMARKYEPPPARVEPLAPDAA